MKTILTLTIFVGAILFPSFLFSQNIDTEPCNVHNWEWAISIPTLDDNNTNSCIQADLSGNMYVAGQFTESISLGDSTYSSTDGNGYLAKYSTSGVLLWSVHIPAFSGIVTDAFDNVYVSGNFSDTIYAEGHQLVSNGSSQDLFVIKYNANAEIQWIKQYGGENNETLGDIKADHLGNIILSGTFVNYTNIEGFPLYDANGIDFIFSINAAGNIAWVQQLGNSNVWGTSMAVKSNNNIVISGIYNSNFSAQAATLPSPATPEYPLADAAFLAEFSQTGSLLWLKQATMGSNSKIVVGIDRSDAIYLGGNFFDGIFMVGDSTYTGPAGFIAKYDQLGNPLWSKKIGDFYFNHVSGIGVDAANNLFISGLLTSSINFGGTPYTGNGSFLAKYSPEGQELKFWSTGGFSYDRTALISTNLNGKVFSTGVFEGSVLFGEHMVTVASGIYDIYMACLGVEAPYMAPEPGLSAGKISFSNITSESAELTWANGDGTSRVIVAKRLGKANENGILDGSSYSDGGGVFGNGSETAPRQYVVYNGTGTHATVTGLLPDMLYSFTALEYNEDSICTNALNYKTSHYKVSYFITPSPTTETLSVFPNPVGENLQVTLATKSRGETNMVLMDDSGRPLQNFNLQIEEDISLFTINLSSFNLLPGIYYLKLNGATNSKAYRIIKQ